MHLMDFLDKKSINLALDSTTKERIISELLDMMVKSGIIHEKEALLDALLEREGLGSTGIGHGVAIPHGKCEELNRPALIFGRSKSEVDFNSIDGKPARIFFLLVAPENGGNDHLHLLAKIARMMKDPHTREKLLQLEYPEEVADLFEKHDTL